VIVGERQAQRRRVAVVDDPDRAELIHEAREADKAGMATDSFLFGDATETARQAFPEVRELGLKVSQPLGPLTGHNQERRDAPYTLDSLANISCRNPDCRGRQDVLGSLQTQLRLFIRSRQTQVCFTLVCRAKRSRHTLCLNSFTVQGTIEYHDDLRAAPEL
jgi:hypothetical protein